MDGGWGSGSSGGGTGSREAEQRGISSDDDGEASREGGASKADGRRGAMGCVRVKV